MPDEPKSNGPSPIVGILMGSPSDKDVMERTSSTLTKLDIPHEMLVRSAHRTPIETIEYARNARKRGIKVLICGAGMAAHLAGIVAAQTILPVIGIPIASGMLKGQDALLSTVQMPRGTPVATVAIDGAVNAAYLAAQILALSDEKLSKKLKALRSEMRKKLIGE